MQELYIEGLDPVNTTILLNALSEDVGQLKSLHVGRNVSYQNMIEMETVAKAFNQVEVLYLDLGGSAGFRDYLCLKATLRRLATPGESNLKYLRLKNFCTFGLFQIPTCGLQQSLSFASSTPLFYLSSLLEYKYNIVGGAEDFYGIEGIMEVLVTVPGERKDKIVRRSEFVEERHFHIHPFGICPENCTELSD